MQLELENGECTATAALRERLDKSESWVPSRAYVETLTAAQAILADTALLGALHKRRIGGYARLRRLSKDWRLRTQTSRPRISSSRSTLRAKKKICSRSKPRKSSCPAGFSAMRSLRSWHCVYETVKWLSNRPRDTKRRSPVFKPRKNSCRARSSAKRSLRSWYCVYKTAKWFFDRPGTTGRRSSVLVPCCAMSTSSHIQNERDEVGVCSFWGVGVEVDW